MHTEAVAAILEASFALVMLIVIIWFAVDAIRETVGDARKDRAYKAQYAADAPKRAAAMERAKAIRAAVIARRETHAAAHAEWMRCCDAGDREGRRAAFAVLQSTY